MSFPNFETHKVQQYSNSLIMLAQQKESKLYSRIMIEQASSERYYKDQYGVHSDMTEVLTRSKDVDGTDIPNARRAVDIRKFSDAKPVDSFDEAQYAISNLSSSIQMGQSAQMGRKIDELILRGSLADALTGKNGTTSTPLPSAQKVAVNDHTYASTTGDVGMTVSKAQVVFQKFDDAQVEIEDRVLVLDPINMQKLISDNKASSTDYITYRPYESGMLPQFMGMDIIVLPQARFEFIAGSATDIRNVAFSRQGMLGIIGKDGLVQAEIVRDVQKESIGSYLVKCNLNFAATRLEESRVIEVINDIT